jgi:hypothetical protein
LRLPRRTAAPRNDETVTCRDTVAFGGPAIETEPVRLLAAFTLKPGLDEIADGYRKSGGELII